MRSKAIWTIPASAPPSTPPAAMSRSLTPSAATASQAASFRKCVWPAIRAASRIRSTSSLCLTGASPSISTWCWLATEIATLLITQSIFWTCYTSFSPRPRNSTWVTKPRPTSPRGRNKILPAQSTRISRALLPRQCHGRKLPVYKKIPIVQKEEGWTMGTKGKPLWRHVVEWKLGVSR